MLYTPAFQIYITALNARAILFRFTPRKYMEIWRYGATYA